MPEIRPPETWGSERFHEAPRTVTFRVEVPPLHGMPARQIGRTAQFSCYTTSPTLEGIAAQYVCSEAPLSGVTVNVSITAAHLAMGPAEFEAMIRLRVGQGFVEAWRDHELWTRLPAPLPETTNAVALQMIAQVREQAVNNFLSGVGMSGVTIDEAGAFVRRRRRTPDAFDQAVQEFLSLPEDQREGRLGP